ncbi:MAG: AEC family transporter [Chloroflexi bacterium]|nr:AEC family transporter [Chloroflexota bacterium]
MSLTELINTFANNILPLILISGAGFVLGKTLNIDSRAIGRVTFYFFSPVLVFSLLTHSDLPAGEILRTGALAVCVTLASGLLALLGGMLLKLDRKALVSTIITSAFANNGNYGLPLIAFAFGQAALAHSSIYLVFSSLLTNTFGVLIASLGHLDLKQAALGMIKVPTIYAVILAMLINQSGITLPVPVDRTISLAAGAGVPLMILLLGLELRQMRWTSNFSALGLSTSIRLLAGPVLGLIFTSALGLKGVGHQVGVMEASMSAAVANTNLASEYELDTSLVAATVFVSTLLSPFTLTPLILFLGK